MADVSPQPLEVQEPMTHAAKILADSVSPDGVRLTTLEVTFPRIILAEFNTHRMLSRNSSSSRAIPVRKMIERVMENPYIPLSWGKNQKGMQAGENLIGGAANGATRDWLEARDLAVHQARCLLDWGVHKQLTNRLLEPFMWHTVIVTATEWDNFFHLRMNKDAHPDIQLAAGRMWEAFMEALEPDKVPYGGWHTPLITPEDSDWMKDAYDEEIAKVSCARCARVSYLTHDGKRDPQKDLELHDGLLEKGHMSPFEHAARPMHEKESRYYKRQVAVLKNGRRINIQPVNFVEVGTQMGSDESTRVEKIEDTYFCGNFNRWVQYRKTIPGEADILATKET